MLLTPGAWLRARSVLAALSFLRVWLRTLLRACVLAPRALPRMVCAVMLALRVCISTRALALRMAVVWVVRLPPFMPRTLTDRAQR